MFNLRSGVQEESATSNASIITIAGRTDLPKVAVGGMEKDIGKSLQGTLEANDKQRKTLRKKTEVSLNEIGFYRKKEDIYVYIIQQYILCLHL